MLDDRDEARRRLREIEAFLGGVIHLRLNTRRTVIAPVGAPCDVLGYVHFSGGRTRVRRRSVRRLWRRLDRLASRVEARELPWSSARASIASWLGLAKHADAFRLSRALFDARDVRNIGKRLLVQTLAPRSTASGAAVQHAPAPRN